MSTLSLAQKQNLLFSAFIFLTFLATIFIYHQTQPQWVFYRKAEKQYMQKDYEKAIVFYEQSLAEGQTTINAKLHLADSYVAIGEFSKAIELYKEYLKIYPHAKEVHYALAKAFFWDHDLEDSEKEYKNVMEAK